MSQYQGVIEPVVVRLESGSVVSRPRSTHFGSQVGELRIDLQRLKDFSFKWLIEIYLGSTYDDSSSNALRYQNIKINFALLDPEGSHGGSTSMQSRLKGFHRGHNVRNQAFANAFDYFLDLNALPPTQKRYLAIRHYVHEKGGALAMQAVTAKLMLSPLDETQTHHDFIRRKFPDCNTTNVVVAAPTVGGSGELRRNNLLVSRYSQNKAFLDESTHSKALNQRESPWLECATVNKISSLTFHAQDEYGQDLKKASDPQKTIRLTISFADVPKNAASG